MTILNQMQDSDQVVHNVRIRTARAMLRKGLVRIVDVQPAPPQGFVAVCLTTKGRSYGPNEPTEPQDDGE